MKHLRDHELHSGLSRLVASERKITAEILEYIKEVSRRRLYSKYDCSSLYMYLTKVHKYSGSAAQRRIDAARVLKECPSVKRELQNGSLNLSQVSYLAQVERQKKKELKKNRKASQDFAIQPSLSDGGFGVTGIGFGINPSADAAIGAEQNNTALGSKQNTSAENTPQTLSANKKLELLLKAKDQDFKTTQSIFAQGLNLEIKEFDQVRMQADGSARIGARFSSETMQCLERVKELVSHTHAGANLDELVLLLGKYFISKQDPSLPKKSRRDNSVRKWQEGRNSEINKLNENSDSITASVVRAHQVVRNTNELNPDLKDHPAFQPLSKQSRKYISVKTRAKLHQIHKGCQWRYPSGELCNSKFQLQIDHKQSIWAGGTNEPENLQLLCGVHNREKYRREC